MRKIDKTKILSTEYKTWIDGLETEKLPHPKYSTNLKYYRDVVMNLLHCQNGLCAYTEVQLCSLDAIAEKYWTNGRYTGGKENDGELDHFDESLKSKKNDSVGKQDWLWDNLFVIQSDRNNEKGTKPIDVIFKPDSIDFDPFDVLEYDCLSHEYIASTKFSEDEQARLQKIIDDVLGMNAPNVVDKRKGVIEKMNEYNIQSEREFPTAQEFYRKLINK